MLEHHVSHIDSPQENSLCLSDVESLDLFLEQTYREIEALELYIESLDLFLEQTYREIEALELKMEENSKAEAKRLATLPLNSNRTVNSIHGKKPIVTCTDKHCVSISSISIESALAEMCYVDIRGAIENAKQAACSIKADYISRDSQTYSILGDALESSTSTVFNWLKIISDSIPKFSLPTFSYPSPKPLI